MDKFWLCYVEGSGGCRRKHFEREKALEEAERLLKLPDNLGKKVYLLEVVGYVHIEPMPFKWESLYSEESYYAGKEAAKESVGDWYRP